MQKTILKTQSHLIYSELNHLGHKIKLAQALEILAGFYNQPSYNHLSAQGIPLKEEDTAQCVIKVLNTGNIIVVPAFPDDCDKIKVLNNTGSEIKSWQLEEWMNSPGESAAEFFAALSDTIQKKDISALNKSISKVLDINVDLLVSKKIIEKMRDSKQYTHLNFTSAKEVFNEMDDFEKNHAEYAQDLNYEKERKFINIQNGRALCIADFDNYCDYIRIIDRASNEIAYWSAEEWGDSPKEVIGAVMGGWKGNELSIKDKPVNKKKM